jgi:hypothetical protein
MSNTVKYLFEFATIFQMDVIFFYSDFLSLFLAMIIVGTAIKLALQEPNGKTYQIGEKTYGRQKVHTAATLALLGVVIQTVSNSVETLDGRSLLLDEKILAAYGLAFAVMVFKK